MPISTMPWRCSAPPSITSMALWKSPVGSSRSPAITSARCTPASPFMRVRNASSSSAVAKLRTARCGTGSKPALRNSIAASIDSARVRRHRAHIDAQFLGRGIDQIGDVVRGVGRVASSEKPRTKSAIAAIGSARSAAVVVGEVVVMASHWPRVPGERSGALQRERNEATDLGFTRDRRLNARKSGKPDLR